ncbi:MAG: amidohydrolase [Acidimicrobiaceae bacterium]|jgi:predicted TIM-barrel fold metal-dependent hydrolase|nr:amidohydrolase [Acidimicrobiaceae bacterium]|tara:strand:- start:61561 stop:62742 length:1182 start_codon:yes stop_codon:yes gene_type:complete
MHHPDLKGFDCDHHYYEAEDAFTRHMDPMMMQRAMQWVNINGKKRLMVGGKINRFIPNPTFDPIAKPGCLDDYFRGKVSVSNMRDAFGELEPLSERPEYRNRDAKVDLLSKQNLDGCLLFPTLGVGMESALEGDLLALQSAFSAFNRWLNEDWGFNYQNRLFAAPYITLSDVKHAISELEFAMDHDVRVINLRASAVTTADGQKSPADPSFDDFWQRVNDAGIAVAFHAGDAAYDFLFAHWGLSTEFEAFRYEPLKRLLNYSNIADTVAALISGGLFNRFPRIRVCTIENGSDWVSGLLRRFSKAYKQAGYAFAEDPVKTFQNHIWVAPYYEDDLMELRELIGVDHILFGSDYPHAEGLATPMDFLNDLEGFSSSEIEQIMHKNGRALVTPRS